MVQPTSRSFWVDPPVHLSCGEAVFGINLIRRQRQRPKRRSRDSKRNASKLHCLLSLDNFLFQTDERHQEREEEARATEGSARRSKDGKDEASQGIETWP